jgi:predicted enzyme related to lactoylglutathione lyase
MNREVTFYRDLLDLKISFPVGKKDYSQENWVTFDTGECILALHGGGAGSIGADSAKFVFYVDDIEAVHAKLLDRGVHISDVRSPFENLKICDCTDPEGHRFSIQEKRGQ